MEAFYFYSFAILAISVVIHGLLKSERFYHYPYFMATTFVIFVLPQAVSLRSDPGGVPLESIGPILFVTILCLGGCLLGSRIKPLGWVSGLFSMPVDLRRLVHAGIVFVAVGFFFGILISRMSIEERGGTMATGRVTIYLFFNQLIYPGLAILLFNAMKKRDLVSWLLVGVAAIIPVQAIIFAGRREGAALFIITIALTLYYQKRIVPPRFVVVAAILFAMIAIPATSTYRTAMSEKDVEAVAEIDLVGNFEKFVKGQAILELRNAAAVMFSTQLRDSYELGAAYWDEIVWRFVPAQFVGSDVKNALMFNPRVVDKKKGPEIVDLGLREYAMPVGSTVTGMGDSFKQFGYFGCLFFVIIAVLFRSLWTASLERDAFFAKLLYMLSVPSAMRAVTHQTVDFLPGLIYNLVFLGLATIYARKSMRRRHPAKAMHAPAPREDLPASTATPPVKLLDLPDPLEAPPAPAEPAASSHKKSLDQLFEN